MQAAAELSPEHAGRRHPSFPIPDGAIFFPEGVPNGYLVYGVFERSSQKFGYVGQTRNFDKRVKSHIRDISRGGTTRRRVRRMCNVIETGGTLSFIVLERCISEEASLVTESAWIAKLASEGHTLHNRWQEHQQLIRAAQDLYGG